MELDQLLREEVLDEFVQVGGGSGCIHFVFLTDGGDDLCQGAPAVQQTPDGGAHLIQTVINAAAQMQDDGLLAENTESRIRGPGRMACWFIKQGSSRGVAFLGVMVRRGALPRNYVCTCIIETGCLFP